MTEEWKGGAFHRNAPHVKQATVKGKHPGFPLAFQEYSPDFPHKKVFREPNLMLRACQSNPQKSYCLRERTTKYRILFFTLVDNVFPSYHNVISVLFFFGGGDSVAQYTLGFAGRPSSSAFYISTVDNTYNHGPGSQGSKTEADACFAKVSFMLSSEREDCRE